MNRQEKKLLEDLGTLVEMISSMKADNVRLKDEVKLLRELLKGKANE